MAMEQTTRSSIEEWMTAEEMAAWLGVTKRVLSANRIPNALVGERRFYNKYDVAEWLRRRRDRDHA